MGSTAPSYHSSDISAFKTDLMMCLGIPLNLADRTDHSLHFVYEKYKAHLKATTTLGELCASGEWQGKKPLSTDLVEVFQSKSMWHSHHVKAFSQIGDYPEMVSWLNKEVDAPSNMELWGFEKATYVFKDIFTFFDNKRKGKGKVGGKGKMKVENTSTSGGGGGGGRKKGDKKKSQK